MNLLKQLIIDRYGESKYELGCQLTAQFVGFGSKEEWTPLKVAKMCEGQSPKEFKTADIERFKKLFGKKVLGFFFS